MTKETNDKELQKVVPADSRITFARKNDLAKVMKKIDKSVDEAIDFLETIMKDTQQDMKLRKEAAVYLIDKRIQLSESIGKDQLARTIAESRLILAEKAVGRQSKVVEDEDEEGSSTPIYTSDVILDVSKCRAL